jgi:hypothetical protein
MMKKHLLATVVLGLASLFIVAGIYAGKCPDVVTMKKDYEHTKGIVEFNHDEHVKYAEQYPKVYENGCGECHHDDQGKPIAGLACGDETKVQSCIDCHSKPGEVPTDLKKEWRKKKLKKAEKDKLELEYHAEAIHANCTSCHKDYNKEYKPAEKAPTTCTSCHPKTE